MKTSAPLLLRAAAALLLAVPVLFATPATAARADDVYSEAELDRLLAPIALYPDTVLSHVLIAATYPLEVAQAARWSRKHPDRTGQDAVEAVAGMDWDPSVKALTAFPELLARMDDDLEWTEDLGDAFLLQEDAVMDRVQYLRDRAYESGHLDSLEHVHVVREREYIYIEPAIAHVVYVPYYDPWYVYGTWWWPHYPPYRWSHWHGHPASHYAHYHGGFYWGTGFRVAPAFYFTSFHWPTRQVVVIERHHRPSSTYYSGRDVARHARAQPWRHEPSHRRGAAYRNEALAREYRGGARTAATVRAESQAREAERSRSMPEARRRERQASRPDEAPVRPRAERPGPRSDTGPRELRDRRDVPDSAREERRVSRPAPRQEAERAIEPAPARNERAAEPRGNREVPQSRAEERRETRERPHAAPRAHRHEGNSPPRERRREPRER